MMKTLVVTSIASEMTEVLIDCFSRAILNDVSCILVQDLKSGTFKTHLAHVVTTSEQIALDLRIAHLLPWNSYSRKNIGYLLALRKGSSWIIETDDDNLPSIEFFQLDQMKEFHVRIPSSQEWVNIYPYFQNEDLWPRGFPLDEIQRQRSINTFKSEINTQGILVAQCLANLDPDVDAIFRLTQKIPQQLKKDEPLKLIPGQISPFNSQATWWARSVSSLLYFPSTVSWRSADIWRSFIVSRIFQTLHYPIIFFGPLVEQMRNKHDLMVDFREEVDCYLNSRRVWETLKAIPNSSFGKSIYSDLWICYKSLVEQGFVANDELDLLEAWIYDHQSVVRST